jgi:hypothetical protein
LHALPYKHGLHCCMMSDCGSYLAAFLIFDEQRCCDDHSSGTEREDHQQREEEICKRVADETILRLHGRVQAACSWLQYPICKALQASATTFWPCTFSRPCFLRCCSCPQHALQHVRCCAQLIQRFNTSAWRMGIRAHKSTAEHSECYFAVPHGGYVSLLATLLCHLSKVRDSLSGLSRAATCNTLTHLNVRHGSPCSPIRGSGCTSTPPSVRRRSRSERLLVVRACDYLHTNLNATF